MDTPKSISEFFEHAINVLFAVVIGISFQISSQIIIPIEQIQTHIVNAGILVLGYGIVVSSWIGYYLSIKEKQHKGKLGYVRFGLDIFIIYLFYYIVNLAQPENQSYQKDLFLYLLPIIYAVFICWDVAKYFEYRKKSDTREDKNDKLHRISITADYFVWFLVLAIFYYIISMNSFYKNILFLALSGFLTFKYRYAKYVDAQRVKAKKRISKRKAQI